MHLSDIRASKTFNDLKPAIELLCREMQKMTWGEFNAYRRTLESAAKAIGIEYQALDSYAITYQRNVLKKLV